MNGPASRVAYDQEAQVIGADTCFAKRQVFQYCVVLTVPAPFSMVASGADQKSSTPYWLRSLVALILRFTARLISPSRARPARRRPSSTSCSNRRAAGEHASRLARQAASVSFSESMRASHPSILRRPGVRLNQPMGPADQRLAQHGNSIEVMCRRSGMTSGPIRRGRHERCTEKW